MDKNEILLNNIDKKAEEILNYIVNENKDKGISTPPNTQILNSNNTILYLDPSQYYDVSIVLVGSVTSDVVVRIDSKIKEGITNASNVNLNNTNNGYILKGARVSSIGVIASTIGSVSVYVSYIGYKDYKMPEFRVL